MGPIGDLDKLFSIKHKTKFTVDPIIFSKINHIDHRIQMGYQVNGVWSTEYFWERGRKRKKRISAIIISHTQLGHVYSYQSFLEYFSIYGYFRALLAKERNILL